MKFLSALFVLAPVVVGSFAQTNNATISSAMQSMAAACANGMTFMSSFDSSTSLILTQEATLAATTAGQNLSNSLQFNSNLTASLNTTLFINVLEQCGAFAAQCAAKNSAIATQLLLSYFKQVLVLVQYFLDNSTGIIIVLVDNDGKALITSALNDFSVKVNAAIIVFSSNCTA